MKVSKVVWHDHFLFAPTLRQAQGDWGDGKTRSPRVISRSEIVSRGFCYTIFCACSRAFSNSTLILIASELMVASEHFAAIVLISRAISCKVKSIRLPFSIESETRWFSRFFTWLLKRT